MNGILIVDKPEYWTSHDVVAKLRNTLKVKRIGHGGTLDPMATGVLPIFIGRATRAAQFSENAQKEYVVGLRLGLVTDTQDITGSILKISKESVTVEKLETILNTFRGAQKQIPPMYSAIKKDGKKLYELARKGIEVERAPRDIYISEITLLGKSDSDYTIRISCSKGTYIRTICHDIGSALGCGGTMSSLRRTRAGPFEIKAAHPLDKVLEYAVSDSMSQILLPVDSLFPEHPVIALGEHATRKLKNGAIDNIKGAEDGFYRLYGANGEFLALAEIVEGKTNIIKGFFMPI